MAVQAVDLNRRPHGQTWLNQPHHRGPWYYSSEVDLGYSGALRTAATILADDPIFGRFCFGGDWKKTNEGIEVTPKDGVRRRFHSLIGGQKVHMILEVDRFVAAQPIVLKEDLSEIRFSIESDNPKNHSDDSPTIRFETGNLSGAKRRNVS